MAKEKPYLEERDIQFFEVMEPVARETYLSQFQQLPKFFIRLLRSYRLAARVANAAWRYIEACQSEPLNVELRQCLIDDMASALSDYAPASFKQPPMESVHIFETVAKLYDQANELGTREEILELLYNEACEVTEQANKAVR
jgi:hypothetical protein